MSHSSHFSNYEVSNDISDHRSDIQKSHFAISQQETEPHIEEKEDQDPDIEIEKVRVHIEVKRELWMSLRLAPILSYVPQVLDDICEMGFEIKFIEDLAAFKAENEKKERAAELRRTNAHSNMRFSVFDKEKKKGVSKIDRRRLPEDERGFGETREDLGVSNNLGSGVGIQRGGEDKGSGAIGSSYMSQGYEREVLGLMPGGRSVNPQLTINDVSYFNIAKRVEGTGPEYDYQEFMTRRGYIGNQMIASKDNGIRGTH